MMKKLFLALIISAALGGTGLTTAQTYSATTNTNVIQYPSPIPCPSSAGCSGGGALVGANYTFTPTDFNQPITRITDATTGVSLGGAQHGHFIVNCGGSAEANFMNNLDNRFYLCDNGTNVHLFTWNGSSATESYIDSSVDGSYFFSFTQNYVAYGMYSGTNGCTAGHLCIDSINVTTATAPTFTVLVDLTSVCPNFSSNSGTWVEDVTVSKDDQTFSTAVAGSGGQGTGQYALVWNRTKGCVMIDILNNVVSQGSGATWGGTGSLSQAMSEYIHNVRMSPSGNYIKINEQCCGNWLWQMGTTTVYEGNTGNTADAHSAIGYTNWVNAHATVYESNTVEAWYIFPIASNEPSGTVLAEPFGNDQHMYWGNDNSTDTAPFLTTTEPDTSSGTNPPITEAWEWEVLAVATNGSGTVWRFAHTYDDYNENQTFAGGNAIGSGSQDGKYFAWSTDWLQMLGNTNLTSSSCTVTSGNCREDVFMVNLSNSNSNSAPLPPTDLTATVQ
jgi:hypothetical protein